MIKLITLLGVIAGLAMTTEGGAGAPADIGGERQTGQTHRGGTVPHVERENFPEDQRKDPRRANVEEGVSKASQFGAMLPTGLKDTWKAITREMTKASAGLDRIDSTLQEIDKPDSQYRDPRAAALHIAGEVEGEVGTAKSSVNRQLTALEAHLARAAMPAHGTTPSARLVARGEIDVYLGDANEIHAADAFQRLAASTDGDVLGELVSEYGLQLMRSRGLDDKEILKVRKAVAGAIADGRGGYKGTDAQKAAKAWVNFDLAKAANAATFGGAQMYIEGIKKRRGTNRPARTR